MRAGLLVAHPNSIYLVPTQFKATQLVVAQAVWAIQPIDSTSQKHQDNIILLLDDNELFLLGNIVSQRIAICLKEEKKIR
jgi:hypothetical protein